MNVNNIARMLLYPCVPRYSFNENNAKVRQLGSEYAIEKITDDDWFYFDNNIKEIATDYAKILIIRESDYVKITSKTGRKSL